MQPGRQAGLQNARHVVQQAAARDVGQALDAGAVLGQRGQHLLHVDARRRHDHVGQRLAVEVVVGLGVGALQDLAQQRIAVGVRAAGRQAQHHVAGLDRLAGDDGGLFDRAHREAGQVVLAVGIHARHFGGFAADQRAARQFAALGDAAHHRRRRIHRKLAAAEIIQEEQRFRALHQDVVDAHGDQVDPHGVVAVPVERQAQLGAHAVGARDQHGFLERLRHFEQAAEAADTGQHAGAHGAGRKRFDTVDQGVACVDVDTGIAVGQGGGRLIRHEKCRGVCNNCWDFGGTPRILRCCGPKQGLPRRSAAKAARDTPPSGGLKCRVGRY
ncbi:hypothetical protein D9M72_273080 [compost metagenome]